MRDWLVSAGFGERRVAVLDIDEDRMRDIGGAGRYCTFLESCDLGAVGLRAIAKTGALLDRKIAALPAERGSWLHVLVSGQLPQGVARGAVAGRGGWRADVDPT